tara:strand:- start:4450 stop:4797 length:348 start_codon:yes stop_codon:yes gene_type:complete
MISNFESGGSGYDPLDDPYANRQVGVNLNFEDDDGDDECTTKLVLFAEIKEALLGIVEHPVNPAIACYSSSMTITLLKKKHGLTEEQANLALQELMRCNLGPNTPCFLDTSIIDE